MQYREMHVSRKLCLIFVIKSIYLGLEQPSATCKLGEEKCKHCFFDFVGSLGTAGMLDQASFPVAVIKKQCDMNLGAY